MGDLNFAGGLAQGLGAGLQQAQANAQRNEIFKLQKNKFLADQEYEKKRQELADQQRKQRAMVGRQLGVGQAGPVEKDLYADFGAQGAETPPDVLPMLQGFEGLDDAQKRILTRLAQQTFLQGGDPTPMLAQQAFRAPKQAPLKTFDVGGVPKYLPATKENIGRYPAGAPAGQGAPSPAKQQAAAVATMAQQLMEAVPGMDKAEATMLATGEYKAQTSRGTFSIAHALAGAKPGDTGYSKINPGAIRAEYLRYKAANQGAALEQAEWYRQIYKKKSQ